MSDGASSSNIDEPSMFHSFHQNSEARSIPEDRLGPLAIFRKENKNPSLEYPTLSNEAKEPVIALPHIDRLLINVYFCSGIKQGFHAAS